MKGKIRQSIHPLHPPGSKIVFRIPATDLTFVDRLIVSASSLTIIGSVVWVPICIVWAWRRWKTIKDKRRKALYAALAIAASVILAAGPHRSPGCGKRLQVRKWRLWQAWLKFIAMEVISDAPKEESRFDTKTDRAILAFVPHGIFPFAFAFAALPEIAQSAAFGVFRPAVASATALFPIVRDFLSWCEAIDASKASVDSVLSKGERVGLVPGGIAEIFEGYPKPKTNPDEEYSIVRRGFLRMAMKHNIPVIPIYTFGATKMMKRLDFPLLETMSKWLRISVVLFFGVWGLPIPFRQRLSYVIGRPIYPPDIPGDKEEQARLMQDLFCQELERIFDRHKEAYGWGHKTLRLLKQ